MQKKNFFTNFNFEVYFLRFLMHSVISNAFCLPSFLNFFSCLLYQRNKFFNSKSSFSLPFFFFFSLCLKFKWWQIINHTNITSLEYSSNKFLAPKLSLICIYLVCLHSLTLSHSHMTEFFQFDSPTADMVIYIELHVSEENKRK